MFQSNISSFSPFDFFFLDHFEHRSLFDGITFVWEALSHLPLYFEQSFHNSIEVDLSPHIYLVNRDLISIGPGTVIEPGAYIEGPAIIGANNRIAHGATIRGYVITGNGCVIGHATEVKQSILLPKAQAPHLNYIGNSIIGNRVNLGAGSKTANLKLDQGEITVYSNEQEIKTGLKKFGSIIGDRSQIGCNTILNPGTLMGQDVLCYPGLTVKGVIPSRTVIKETGKMHQWSTKNI